MADQHPVRSSNMESNIRHAAGPSPKNPSRRLQTRHHRRHRTGRLGSFTHPGRPFGNKGFRHNHHRILCRHRPRRSREPILKQCLHTQLPDKKVLLVDDVSDGGRSLQLAKKHLQEQGAKEIKIATVYCKPGTITTPDYFEKETSHWIVFPWEARETMTKIMQKAEGKRALGKEIANLVRAGFPKQLAEKLLKTAAGANNAVSHERIRQIR